MQFQQIYIAGIPTHLCHNSTVKAILKPRCIVDHITFNPIDNKYHIDAHAHSPNAIPSVAHLAVNKFDNGQSLLHMWPLFLETEDVTSENYLNMQFQLEEQNRDIGTCTLSIFFYLCKKPTHPISKLLIIGDGTVQANQNDHGGSPASSGSSGTYKKTMDNYHVYTTHYRHSYFITNRSTGTPSPCSHSTYCMCYLQDSGTIIIHQHLLL
jgi:hypothetical protein